MRRFHIQFYRTRTLHWFGPFIYNWRAVHNTNGHTLATGEGYTNIQARDYIVGLLFGPDVLIREVGK